MAAVVSFQYKREDPLDEGFTYAKVIRLQENGFCIALFHAASKQIVQLEQYLFDDACTLKEKIGCISEVEKKWDFKSVSIIGPTRINTQIPLSFHNDRNNDLYLPLLTKDPYHYQVLVETVNPFQLCNVSAWNKDLYLMLKEQFPNCQLKSEMAVLLQLLSHLTGDSKLLVFLESGYMRLLASRNGKLLGANGFAFEGKNDFLYYLVGFAQTMFGEIAEPDVHLMGDIERTSLLYVSMQKYFSRIHFVNLGYTDLQHQIHRFCDLLYEEA